MPSDPKQSESPPIAQVSKLVIGAIKSLKKTKGSSSESILQYIKSQNSINIDANDVERCLEKAHAEEIITIRTNEYSGVKFYKISTNASIATNKMQKGIEDEKNNSIPKKHKRGRVRTRKDVNICELSTDSLQKSEEKTEDSNSTESKEPAPETREREPQKNLFCEICKVPVSSKKNLEVHENGRKHKNMLSKIMEKEQKRSKRSSNSSSKPTEKMDKFDNHSSNAPSDVQHSGSEKETEKSKRSSSSFEKPTEKRDKYDPHSSNTPSDLQYSSSSESNYDASNRRKNHSRDYRNGHSDNYYSPNRREPYYSNRNYDVRHNYRNRYFPNEPFRNGQNRRFQSLNRYDRYDQNYGYDQSQWMRNGPQSKFDNWVDMRNSGDSEFYSESVQSENIQPENIQPAESNTNYDTHSINENFDEMVKTSTDEQKSPSRKLIKVVSDKKARRSPRIQIKVIPKTTSPSEDDQSQLVSEKQQEKSVVLSENMTGKRLAHWINPSNQKDQAEIRRLVTEFSKSKKKENLIKLKQHTDKVTINNGVNHSAVEEANNVSSLPTTPEVPESENSAQISSETIANVLPSTLATNSPGINKRQRSSSFTEIAPNANSPFMLLPSARNRSESLTLDENAKKPRTRHTKRIASNPCESPSSRKRKDSVELGNNSKKHKCSSAECLEKCIESAISNADTLTHPERTETAETTSLPVNTASNDLPSQNEKVYIKKEIFDETDTAQMGSLSLDELIQKQTDVISNCQDDASMTPVESLINLFATGNITIKKEFDDPLIDAIRSIDPALLNKVCEEESDKTVPSQETVEKAVEPIITPPPATPDSSLVPLSNAPSLTLSLKNILNELQIISEEEEKVKDNLLKADQQIQYYQSVLDEWKTKKIKFQSEEEILRNKRNTLVRTMNDLVVQQSSESIESRSTTESPAPEERPPSNLSQSANEINNTIGPVTNDVNMIESNQPENESSTAPQLETTTENSVEIDNEDDVIPMEGDDVVILPLPESRIPVIDLDRVGSPEKNNDTDVFSKKNHSADSITENCHKIRDLVAHNAVINSIQIFDDYVYTCANDKLAKRFSLKDPNETVTYTHAEKNIYHLFVEKMRGKTYVFTAAFNSNLITVFDAESAHKVKVFQFGPKIAGMCKGRFKIYVGLRDGYIGTCDWKEQKDLVNIGEYLRSIATTHQGGINILITLSTKGHVSIRDADRNGLLIKYVKALAHVPLFMSIYNDWVYLSSAGYLSVLDLSSGTFVKKYELPAAYTSLTVYKDHIFTTSFSGFVRCYSKYDIGDVKAYYGAGKLALTCIHAHDGWIFTGNRTGEISVFKFDPETSLPCQFGKCQMVFARLDDLMYHVLQGKDHNLVSLKNCLWRKCNAMIKRNWDQEAIHNHIRAHITASFPYLHEPMYNLIV